MLQTNDNSWNDEWDGCLLFPTLYRYINKEHHKEHHNEWRPIYYPSKEFLHEHEVWRMLYWGEIPSSLAQNYSYYISNYGRIIKANIPQHLNSLHPKFDPKAPMTLNDLRITGFYHEYYHEVTGGNRKNRGILPENVLNYCNSNKVSYLTHWKIWGIWDIMWKVKNIDPTTLSYPLSTEYLQEINVYSAKSWNVVSMSGHSIWEKHHHLPYLYTIYNSGRSQLNYFEMKNGQKVYYHQHKRRYIVLDKAKPNNYYFIDHDGTNYFPDEYDPEFENPYRILLANEMYSSPVFRPDLHRTRQNSTTIGNRCFTKTALRQPLNTIQFKTSDVINKDGTVKKEFWTRKNHHPITI